MDRSNRSRALAFGIAAILFVVIAMVSGGYVALTEGTNIAPLIFAGAGMVLLLFSSCFYAKSKGYPFIYGIFGMFTSSSLLLRLSPDRTVETEKSEKT